jgi:hypothetical protein
MLGAVGRSHNAKQPHICKERMNLNQRVIHILRTEFPVIYMEAALSFSHDMVAQHSKQRYVSKIICLIPSNLRCSDRLLPEKDRHEFPTPQLDERKASLTTSRVVTTSFYGVEQLDNPRAGRPKYSDRRMMPPPSSVTTRGMSGICTAEVQRSQERYRHPQMSSSVWDSNADTLWKEPRKRKARDGGDVTKSSARGELHAFG